MGDRDECQEVHDYIFKGGNGEKSLAVWRSDVQKAIDGIDAIKKMLFAVATGILILIGQRFYDRVNPPAPQQVIVQSTHSSSTTTETR